MPGCVIFLECQVHEAVSLWRTLHEQPGVLAHLQEKGTYVCFDNGAGIVFAPWYSLDTGPLSAQHGIYFCFGSYAGRLVTMQPIRQMAKQWSQRLLPHQ